jgi:hypothetical protein
LNKSLKVIIAVLIIVIFATGSYEVYKFFLCLRAKDAILARIISSLDNDAHETHVVVMPDNDDAGSSQSNTVIITCFNICRQKAFEYRFSFSGRVLHLQVLGIDCTNFKRGEFCVPEEKNIHVSLRLLMLNGANSEIKDLTHLNKIPPEYQLSDIPDKFEKKFWKSLWQFALVPDNEEAITVTNTQIKLPEKVDTTLFYRIQFNSNGSINVTNQKDSS